MYFTIQKKIYITSEYYYFSLQATNWLFETQTSTFYIANIMYLLVQTQPKK